MRIAEVVGRVTMSRLHPNLRGCRFLLARVVTAENLGSGSAATGEELVVVDSLGASPGGLIGLSEGREAANPYGKTKVPVDAYCACLIDRIDL